MKVFALLMMVILCSVTALLLASQEAWPGMALWVAAAGIWQYLFIREVIDRSEKKH